MIVYLITGFAFLAFFLIFFTILYLLSKKKDPVALRLKGLKGDKEEKERIALSLKGTIDLLGLSSDQTKGTRIWLAQAGYRQPSSVSNYYGARLFGSLFMGLLGVLIGVFFHFETPAIFLTAFAGIALGAFVPRIWVGHKITQRRWEIRRSVPNMLDLMVVCVEAGLSLNAAMQKIAEETSKTHQHLSEELNLVNQEILIGKTRAEAFRNLARRTGVEELRTLAVMLIQADKLGTSIANSLRVLADSLRVRRRQMAEESAHKISVKLVFPLVLLILPELLVILLGPAIITLFKTFSDMAK